jgi:uncharacterized protein
MTRIGVLSDTHGKIHPKYRDFFESCDEIWHAGDIGDIETADLLAAFKPLRAVYGNIDDHKIRLEYPLFQVFQVEQVKVVLVHIGGYPGHYDSEARKIIEKESPGLFVCGHSHILKVMYDHKYSLLHINPGAAGFSGFQQVITMVRFTIEQKEILNLEIFEAKRAR